MTETSEFQRGRDAGAIAEKLAQHDRHFAAINGSIERLANEMHEMNLSIDRMNNGVMLRDAETVAAAAALRKSEEARQYAADHTWSRFQKVFVVVTALAGLATVISITLTLLRT